MDRVILLMLMCLLKKGVASNACPVPPCLFYSNGTNIKSLEIASLRTTVVVRDLLNATAVEVHVKKNLLFWAEHGPRFIRRANLTSGKIEEVISTGVGHVGGLSVEWESGLLYWTDVSKRRVEVARLDGNSRRVLLDKGVSRPRAIAVDPRNGLLFMTIEGRRPRIERSFLSGESRTTIVELHPSHQHWPNQIIIDFEEERVYWIDAFWDTIESVDYNGEDWQQVEAGRDVIYPVSLTIINKVLYWTDSGLKLRNALHELDHVKARDHQGDHNGGLGGLALIDPSRQPSGRRTCRNRGPCSHLCLLTPHGYRCACPTGVALKEDGKTCEQDRVDDLLLVASFDKGKIYQVTFDEGTPQRSALNLKNVRQPLALAFDHQNVMLYWTDAARGRILRAHLDGYAEEVIVDRGLRSPEGLAVDATARNLYWTDSGTGKIEVARLDGSHRRVLISKDLHRPLDIVLDIKERVMYWVSAGKNPSIEMANMDGSDRQVVTHFPKSLATHVPSPRGLALDPTGRKLYFTDRNLGRLQFIDLRSEHPKFTTLVSYDDYMRRPYGMAVDAEHVYWADTSRGALYRADKLTGGGVKELTAVEGPRGVLVYHKSLISADNHTCAQGNGGCTHLCLARPNGHHCACPSHLADGDSCVEPPTEPASGGSALSTSTAPSPSTAHRRERLLTSKPYVVNATMATGSRDGGHTEALVPSVASGSSCDDTTCLNGGWCSQTGFTGKGPCFCPPDYALGRCQLFIGSDKVRMTFKMAGKEWRKDQFKRTLSGALTEFCAMTKCRLSESPPEFSTVNRRAADEFTFKPDDVIVPRSPHEVGDEMLEVEAAVLRPLRYSTEAQKLVPGRVVCEMVKFSAGLIGEKFGGHKLVYINGEEDPACNALPVGPGARQAMQEHPPPVSWGLVGAIVAVIVLGVAIIIAATALLLGYKRDKIRQLTILPKFIRNPEQEYKRLPQEGGTTPTERGPPTYEEIMPKSIPSGDGASNNNSPSGVNNEHANLNEAPGQREQKVGGKTCDSEDEDIEHAAGGEDENGGKANPCYLKVEQ